MDLQPFYDLRTRLHDCAIAGASLVADDFRLRRAVEGMSALEAAAPVFQKLGQLSRTLLQPDCTDRAGALLDALTLADAIACTQAAVSVTNPVEPLEIYGNAGRMQSVPYSVLVPLLEALTGSASGKYSFVLETHEQRPDLFRDYRVLGALVQALGAGYSELADRAEEWLSGSGEKLFPLLQKDFGKKGKREMVRRIHVIEALEGKRANAFYLEQLEQPESVEKDVRAALIYALRLEEDNAEKLRELCKTERGTCRNVAKKALVELEETFLGKPADNFDPAESGEK